MVHGGHVHAPRFNERASLPHRMGIYQSTYRQTVYRRNLPRHPAATQSQETGIVTTVLPVVNTAHSIAMYPTRVEFEALLKTRTIDWIIDNYIFDGQPFYSADAPEVHNQMVRAISIGLKVPQDDICVVGSARIGFSLSPLKFGEPFSDFSDIDICIVSSSLFDPSWLDIIEKRRTQPATMNSRTKFQLREHRERHYVFNGWIYPKSVVQALEIGQRWLRTFNGLSRISELASRTISGRLYRTWAHARLYHRGSLEKVKRRNLR